MRQRQILCTVVSFAALVGCKKEEAPAPAAAPAAPAAEAAKPAEPAPAPAAPSPTAAAPAEAPTVVGSWHCTSKTTAGDVPMAFDLTETYAADGSIQMAGTLSVGPNGELAYDFTQKGTEVKNADGKLCFKPGEFTLNGKSDAAKTPEGTKAGEQMAAAMKADIAKGEPDCDKIVKLEAKEMVRQDADDANLVTTCTRQ